MANLMQAMANQKTTENGAYAVKSTTNAIVDLFGMCGALRSRSEKDIIELWTDAYNENPELAFKMIFYIRNVRGGLGERDTFRTLLKHVANTYPEFVKKNIDNIPFYGRYDDLFVLLGTPVEEDMIKLVAKQLDEDNHNMSNKNSISLLAKWMPSINASSANTKATANKVCKLLAMTPVQYRKQLSTLRSYLDVTEVKMSNNDWLNIDYKSVPSNAMNKHSKAFSKHDEDGFAAYLEAVKSGKVEINSATLYPYDLVRKVYYGSNNDVAELQWKSLPDYFEGREFNALVMADVSGSMSMGNAQPIMTSIGLAIYFAEHNKGAFADRYLTFTDIPKIREIKPNQSLYSKVLDVRSHGIGYNTNLEAAFDLVLSTAVNNNIDKKDMPESIIVISDMEIDAFDLNTTFLKSMEKRFVNAGYTLPKLVWWNVNARNNTFHADASDNAQFISGSSTAAFKSLIDGKTLSAYELVVQVLADYDRVIVD